MTQEEYEKIMQENKIAIRTIVISTEKHLILSKFTHLVGKKKKKSISESRPLHGDVGRWRRLPFPLHGGM